MDVVNSLLRAARAGNLKRVLEIIEDELVDINVSNNNGLTALHSACKEGHTRIVEQLLVRGANVHARTLKGNQPIHIASLAGHEPVVRILLDNGADVNAQSTSGFTSLYMAAQENHESIVRLLLDRGAVQNISTTDGFTPLAVSLQQNHENIAKILLNHEARGQVRFPGITDTGRSLLHVAAKKNDCAAAALLLQNNISPDVTSKSNFTSLHVACHYGNEAVAKLLIDNGADVNFQAKQNITPLHVAARWNQLAMVNLLLDYGARIDAQTKDHLTPLHCAARMGHDACVELLIQRGAPISAKTRSHLVPLHMSAQGNHLRSAQILLNNRAPVDDVTIDHLTSLHVASHCGHVKVAKLLLDYKANPNIRAQNGFTSLHIACKKNHLEIVKLLLKYGASLRAVTESGLSCLHIASFMGCVEIVIYLLDHDAEIEAKTIRGETPLILATRSNQFEVIDVLLRYGANANACDQNHQNALHLSARLGNAKIAKLLIDRGIDIDASTRQMYTALHIASKENHQNVVALLLENGANISCATKNHEFFPLHLASKYGNDKIVELLLNYGAPVDARGKNDVTSLMVASHYDHPRVVELLLMFGASPHAAAKNGYTAIHIAAKGNRIDCSNILLQNGADPNVESKAGFCPLHLASQEGRANMAALLLENGARVNCRAKNGITPLHLCAQEDHVSVAQLLVKYGAHLDAQTRNGFTPLHVACHFTRVHMIRFLLANGANVNVPAASGYTSLHQASQQGNPQIVDLLLQYNAKPDALTDNGHSALSIAENLGHVSVIDTLRIVTETVIKTTKTTITEERFKIIAPETMQETFISDSEDEADDTPAHQESVKFLTTDVMKSFNNTMAEENYNTSQSNLNATSEQQAQPQAQLRRQRSQQSNEQLSVGGGAPRTTRIADEMSQDLQYLSREAPLDGGESTFGAYSTLGGSQPQQLADNGQSTTVTHQSTYKSTVTRTSSTQLGDDDALLLDESDRHPSSGRLENDYERTDFRIDGDDDATQVYDYNQKVRTNSFGSNGNRDKVQASFGDQHQQQLEQLAPDNVDIQRPLQQAGQAMDTTEPPSPNETFDAGQQEQWQQHEQERLAEVSRVEIEQGDLDNALGLEDEPIQMVDLVESERTMQNIVEMEATERAVSTGHQQQQNLQVVNSSSLPLKPFLVSFMVDARGGAMRGCRHSGVRVIIPPNTAPQPMRITCRYLRRERLVHPPPLMEGEACASKIMEVGPAGARFLGPVLIEVPHFASLRGKEREIIILRSDSGEVWREHLFDTDEDLVDSIIGNAELVEQQQQQHYDQENQRPSSAIGQTSQTEGLGGGDTNLQQEKRLTRIVTNEFPQYFAIISRVRQEVHTVGPDGLAVDSQVVPRVQAIFTDGALTKRIKIGLQKKNGAGSQPGSPEPHQQSGDQEELRENVAGQERTRSPSGGRPGSAQAKRKSRFLACFGASHGSHDLLDQSGTDAEGFASGSNESSSSSAGGDSPRQLANEKLIERRHIIEDLTDSEADDSLDGLGATKSKMTKKRSVTGNELVPEDYYMESEPAFILNVRPKTYGKRLASSSAQTDQKLQQNGFLTTSTRSPKRRGVNLLNVARRRRNKTQMQIPLHEPAAQLKTSQKQQQQQQLSIRPKSADLGTSVADSSLESQHAEDHLDERMMIDGSILATEDDEVDQKWRTCTIQTDSDSVTVQYVTLSSLTDAGAAAAAATTANKSTMATGQDDGYVSGSGELKRTAGADQTGVKTSHKSGLFLPFCSSSSAAEDDDLADGKTSEKSDETDIKRENKRKKVAKNKEFSGGISGKASPVKLDVVLETKAEQQPLDDKVEVEQKQVETVLIDNQDQSGPQLSTGEEADESLVISTTTSRSISPTSKERKQQLKLEKQEKLRKEKLDRLKQKELDEANAKALKAQKKLEKEAKKRAEKEEKLAKRAAASSSSKQQSPSESRAQSPEQVTVSKQQQAGDESKTNEKSNSVIGAITKTIQSVKFAPSPSKDSPSDKPVDKKTTENSDGSIAADQSDVKRVGDDETVAYNEDGSMVHVSIGTDSHLLTESEPRSGEVDQDENEAQLISFSSEPEAISSTAAGKLSSSGEQAKVLKPILKQQSSSIEEPQAIASAELKIAEPKTLSSIADELISEATEEAVRAADALRQQQAQFSSSTSSPTLTSSASDSKKEVAKRLKAEKEKFKAELKSSFNEEKRLSKEAKRLAKKAEEAARKAEREAKKSAVEAKEEAERQAEIAKQEAQAALKLIEAKEEPADGATSSASETKVDKIELKKRAKQAEAEAKRLAKEAEDEAKRLAKEAKKEAKEAAAKEKARLKAEKKQKAKFSVEPSAPSIDLISSSSPETSKASPQKELESEVVVDSESNSKSVPIGLPTVSFELERGQPQVKPVDPAEPEIVAPVDDDAPRAAPKDDATQSQLPAEVVPEISDKSASEPAAESTISDKKDKKASKSKQKKKDKKKKKKKRAASEKKDGDAASISSSSSSKDVSLPTETVSKSSSFLGRLFRVKPKQRQKQLKESDDGSEPLSSATLKSDGANQQDQMMIVSEMYPSDPNNADGEMILEVNLPDNLMGETQQAHFNSTSQERSPEEKIESVVTSLVTSTTGQQLAEPTDDQEATLVNLSQMKDDVNYDEDDDEATENVLSQANDLVEDHQQQQPELPTVAQDDLKERISSGEAEPSSTTELNASESQKVVSVAPIELEIDKSGAEQQQHLQVVSQEGATDAIEASSAPQVASSSQAVGSELAKDEKARKELEAKLEKEAKKRAKEEEKARKKQEKVDKKRAEVEAKKQAKEEKERKKLEAKEAKKMAEVAKKEAKKNKQKAGPTTNDANLQDPAGGDGTGAVESAAEQDPQQPTTITTTTITSTSTTAGDERTLNPNIGDQVGDGSGHVIMSTMSEVPINEETEVERIVEEVVGDDGTITKTTKTVETKYVTMRQEEIRVAERRDMSVEDWERLQAERAEQQPSTSDEQFIERIKRQATSDMADYCSPELDEICAIPSYFDTTQTPAEIKPETSEKKALKMRFRLNQKLIKRAQKLAKVESKKAKRDQRRAEAEIAVCDEAARQARKELKCAVKEAKRAAKSTEKQHKKMDKIDKKLTKRAKELEKRQKKIDKQLAKAAKKQAKKDAKAAKKEAKLQRAGSGSSKSPSRSSKRSIRAEDIGEPVLRSSSRLSIVQNNPNVELSIQQPVEQTPARASLQMDANQQHQIVVESVNVFSDETSSGPQQQYDPLDEINQVSQDPSNVLAETEAQAMRMELEAAREEDDEIDVVGEPDEPLSRLDQDEPPPVSSPSPETNSEETAVDENRSPKASGGKGKKNKRRNKKQKSKESAE